MTRDAHLTRQQYDQSIAYTDDWFTKMAVEIKVPSANPDFRPQYIFRIATTHVEQMLRCYSRGDDARSLAAELPLLLDAWEQAEAAGRSVWSPQIQASRHRWDQNFDQYQFCFWLTGLALALEVDDEPWRRLLALMETGGGDLLLDRIIATRSPQWPVREQLRYPWIHGTLLEAIDRRSEPGSAERLFEFVDAWYRNLGLDGRGRRLPPGNTPYWYHYGPIVDAYFGQWCVEAMAAVKAFGLDDSLCVGHGHYPGDLLRSDAPDLASDATDRLAVAEPAPAERPTTWLARLFRSSR